MQTLTCPVPDNINPLQSNGFMFNILKLPEIQFFCQEVSIPEIAMPYVSMATPLVNTKFPGDKPDYGDLTVQFLIDESMDNYVAIHRWLIGMGFPESWEQYTDFIYGRTSNLNISNETAAAVSDGVLQILNSSNNVARTIYFTDIFPTSLNSLQLQSSTQDTTYLAGVATFGYTLYRIE